MLTSRSLMAVQAMLYIGEHGFTTPISSRQLVAYFERSARYFEPLLQGLVSAQLLRTQRGPKGGYFLAKDKSKIMLLDIIEAVAESNTPPTLHAHYSALLTPYLHTHTTLQATHLSSISLYDLLQTQKNPSSSPHFAI